MRREKKERESLIESRLVKYAQRCGGIPLKLNTMGHNSWPDRAFFMPKGKLILVEVKRPGKDPTPLQASLHRKLRKLGHHVNIIRSLDVFKALLKAEGF